MPLFALGLNHHTAPLAIRERVAFEPGRLIEALHGLCTTRPVSEAAILSTCNRMELYFEGDSPAPAADWLSHFHRVPSNEITPYLYTLPHKDAIRHMFRVTSGLDSMVLGEPQILGQVKEAARQAEAAGTLGSTLHKLFQHSFSVAKEVRSNTAIGANVVSMAAAAVRLTERIFESISEQRILFIGAGEMIELCATHFQNAAPKEITFANRTTARAASLAERFDAKTLTLEEIGDVFHQYDIIVSCTASPLPIVGLGMAKRAIKERRHRPMVMVDLAVPRDIEVEVSQLDDVFLYTVDDLAHIVNTGLASREQAVVEAEVIINDHVNDFLHWMGSRDAVPTIRALRQQAETLRTKELERAQRHILKGEDPAKVLEALSTALTNKLLHAPTHFLNKTQGDDLSHAIKLFHQAYGLSSNTVTPPPPEA